MPDEDIAELLEELRIWARAQHGRQLFIATTLGISPQSVSTWINGSSIPSWRSGEKIRKFLDEQKRKRPKTNLAEAKPAAASPKAKRPKAKKPPAAANHTELNPLT